MERQLLAGECSNSFFRTLIASFKPEEPTQPTGSAIGKSELALRQIQPHIKWTSYIFHGEQSSGSVKLTTNLHLISRLMFKAMPPLPHTFYSVVFTPLKPMVTVHITCLTMLNLSLFPTELCVSYISNNKLGSFPLNGCS
jgi:hypothetical protein